MYVTIAIILFLKIKRVEVWKKIIVGVLTVPEYIGFIIWLTNDSKTNRIIYLWCQYFSYFTLLGSAVYHFLIMLYEYIAIHEEATGVELSVTGTSLLGCGSFGLFFLMSFQDYNALENRLEPIRTSEVESETNSDSKVQLQK